MAWRNLHAFFIELYIVWILFINLKQIITQNVLTQNGKLF